MLFWVMVTESGNNILVELLGRWNESLVRVEIRRPGSGDWMMDYFPWLVSCRLNRLIPSVWWGREKNVLCSDWEGEYNHSQSRLRYWGEVGAVHLSDQRNRLKVQGLLLNCCSWLVNEDGVLYHNSLESSSV